MSRKKSSLKAIAPLFLTDFRFETKGRQVNVTKIAKSLARQMKRQYVAHSAYVLQTKVRGKLVTTTKGRRLSPAQKLAGKKLARDKLGD